MIDTDNSAARISRNIAIFIAAGSVIGALSFGIRSSFGIFLQPISADFGWGREVFAFSIALSSLLWGVAQPFAGMLADRFGSGRVLVVGTLMYAAGTALMAWSSTPLLAHLTVGVLVGLGSAGCGLWIVYAAVSRVVAPERRTLALGIISAAGSFGQFAMVPIGQAFLNAYGWQTAFILLGIISLIMVPMASAITGRAATPAVSPQRFRSAMAEAAQHRGYLLLNAGFFVCGFHVVFIATHLPAYVADIGLPAEIGAWLGGRLFDLTGSYEITWWIAVGLGFFAAVIHYPIDERPIERVVPAAGVV